MFRPDVSVVNNISRGHKHGVKQIYNVDKQILRMYLLSYGACRWFGVVDVIVF